MIKTKHEKAFGRLKIVQAEDKFRARRDEHLIKKLEEQKDLLAYWFANEYPEMELKIHLILSRHPQELEVRKELKYYSNKNRDNSFSMIALTDTVDAHTWYNPYLIEKYVDSFVDVHKDTIVKLIERIEN